MKKILLSLFFMPLVILGNTSCQNKHAEQPAQEAVKQESSSAAVANNVDHSKWDALLKKNVSSTGKVNYKGFVKDKAALESYLKTLDAGVPASAWSRNATLSYWINAYNAYTVKLIVDNYPVKSIKEISDPWGKKFFTLGGKKYSLEQIEHQILRKMGEPRIHFAINCASYSCPDLLNEAYTEEKLSKQLAAVAKDFINDKTKNTITASSVEISEIFNWFGADFKTKGSIIDYLNQYSTVKINSKAKISFKYYNWSLNE
ncbi:DUF547 domain-containing protein [Flavobacterium algicola]|uniref:DUF547 domain-containing protein n=1 Tax=Flavobacterium algicola TaxID=556529 RepID=UPI001EFE996F|nr:DUF547 domain-containing protein [Flavobacterium algicola]MCG9792246.1 DUF547 domain-containing protein [Flavobacterium algicola]